MTFLPAFVPHGQPVGAVSALFGAIFIALTAAYFAVLLVVAGHVERWLADPRIRRRMERLTGVVLIAFGSGSPSSAPDRVLTGIASTAGVEAH